MKKAALLTAFIGLLALFASPAAATNGINLIGIGPVSRSMGGVGIASANDVTNAVFVNPAVFCSGLFYPGSELNISASFFMPRVDANVETAGTTFSAKSTREVFVIPAFGIMVPITKTMPIWRFGLGAYGESGLGVNYRGSAIDQRRFFDFGPMGQFPLIAGEYTKLQILKIAPSVVFQPIEGFSLGLALQISHGILDLGSDSTSDTGYGVQFGMLYKPSDAVSLGATYTSPQKLQYKQVVDIDGDGNRDNIGLDSPQQAGFGVAFEPLKGALLIEGDVKWINWSGTKGYEDFDWRDQWVFAFGIQYKPIKKLALRAGYNYGNNPLKEHNGFVGLTPAGPHFTSIQGKSIPTYYYETFRVIGGPAIAVHHITFGVGYELSKRLLLNAGYMHAFRQHFTESGTNIAGQQTVIGSKLSMDSIEFGLIWRF
jgi:long-chain fatty acid transport protein